MLKPNYFLNYFYLNNIIIVVIIVNYVKKVKH